MKATALLALSASLWLAAAQPPPWAPALRAALAFDGAALRDASPRNTAATLENGAALRAADGCAR